MKDELKIKILRNEYEQLRRKKNKEIEQLKIDKADLVNMICTYGEITKQTESIMQFAKYWNLKKGK